MNLLADEGGSRLTGEKGAAVPSGKILLHTEERRFGGRGRPTLEVPAAVVLDPDR